MRKRYRPSSQRNPLNGSGEQFGWHECGHMYRELENVPRRIRPSRSRSGNRIAGKTLTAHLDTISKLRLITRLQPHFISTAESSFTSHHLGCVTWLILFVCLHFTCPRSSLRLPSHPADYCVQSRWPRTLRWQRTCYVTAVRHLAHFLNDPRCVC